jgi:hypothetical protein
VANDGAVTLADDGAIRFADRGDATLRGFAALAAQFVDPPQLPAL